MRVSSKKLGLGVVALAVALMGSAAIADKAHDGGKGGPMGRMGPSFDFAAADTNKDGKVTPEEFAAYRTAMVAGIDTDNDGKLSLDELVAMHMKNAAERAKDMSTRMVQDLDAEVQKAVHRVQPHASVQALMLAARTLGFESINVDLIYGLPRQTPESFARTIAQVSALRPDRIALYAYAHLPQRFKPQRRIAAEQLPPPDHRVKMLGCAMADFTAQGYTYIGMDHFALPGDALAAAKRQGRLHRNFQGYSTQPDCDLIALGVSAIGRMGATYSQNAKTLDEYYDALRLGQFPIVRGLALTRDDLVRRAVVMALMCQGRLEFESIELAHLVKMRDYFRAELDDLAELQNLGLVELRPDGVQVTGVGWYFVRAVAMVFDKHLRADQVRERFSRII